VSLAVPDLKSKGVRRYFFGETLACNDSHAHAHQSIHPIQKTEGCVDHVSLVSQVESELYIFRIIETMVSRIYHGNMTQARLSLKLFCPALRDTIVDILCNIIAENPDSGPKTPILRERFAMISCGGSDGAREFQAFQVAYADLSKRLGPLIVHAFLSPSVVLTNLEAEVGRLLCKGGKRERGLKKKFCKAVGDTKALASSRLGLLLPTTIVLSSARGSSTSRNTCAIFDVDHSTYFQIISGKKNILCEGGLPCIYRQLKVGVFACSVEVHIDAMAASFIRHKLPFDSVCGSIGVEVTGTSRHSVRVVFAGTGSLTRNRITTPSQSHKRLLSDKLQQTLARILGPSIDFRFEETIQGQGLEILVCDLTIDRLRSFAHCVSPGSGTGIALIESASTDRRSLRNLAAMLSKSPNEGDVFLYSTIDDAHCVMSYNPIDLAASWR
jgi:hypothetical protein